MHTKADKVSRREYFAFISYAHEDVRWAKWLARALEAYRVPATIARRLRLGSRKLGYAFRDDDEARASRAVSGEVTRALNASKNLIVICSSAAARSAWVNDEIVQFEALHGSTRTLYLIVDGVPGASRTAGADPGQECFPPELLRQAGPDVAKNAPLAPDVRRSRKRGALLKLIAGMLDVEFDELYRRDLQRSVLQGVAASVVLAAVGVGALVLQLQRVRAQAERDAQMVVAYTRNSQRSTDEDDPSGGLDWALKAIGVSGNDTGKTGTVLAEDMARWALTHLRETARSGLDAKPVALMADPASTRFVSCLTDGSIRIFEAATLSEIGRASVDAEITSCGYDRGGKRIFATTNEATVYTLDVKTLQGRRLGAPGDNVLVAGTFVGSDGSVAAAQSNGKVFLYPSDGAPRRLIHAHGFMDRVMYMEPTLDSRKLVSVAYSQSAIIDIAGGAATQFGHSAPGARLDVHPQGDRFLVAYVDGLVEQRSAADGEVLQRWELRGTPTQSAYSTDGARIQLASRLSGPAVLDTASGDVLWQVQPGGEMEFNAAASMESAVALFSTGSGIIAQAKQNGETRSILLRSAPETQLVAAEGRYLITISTSGIIQSWDLNWPPAYTSIDPPEGIEHFISADLLESGDVLLLDASGQIWRRNAERGDLQRWIKIDGSPSSIAALPDGRLIVSLGDSTLQIIDPATSKPMATFHHDGWTVADFSTDRAAKRLLVTFEEEEAPAYLWDMTTGRQIARVGYDESTVSACGLSRDGTRAVVTTEGGLVSVWNAGASAPKILHALGGEFVTARLDAKGEQVVSLTDDLVQIWNVTTGEVTAERKFPEILAIEFLSDGRLAATFLHSVEIVDAVLDPTGIRFETKEDLTLTGVGPGAQVVLKTENEILVADADRGGVPRRIAQGSFDQTQLVHDRVVTETDGHVRAWSLDGKELSLQARGWREDESELGTPNGMRLEKKGEGAVILRDLEDRALGEVAVPYDEVRCFDVTHDGKRVLIASESNTLWLWEVPSGTRTPEVALEPTKVRHAVLGDGDKVAFHRPDVFARMGVAAGREAVDLQTDSGRWIESIAVSSSGKYLASGGRDHTARVWDFSGREIARCELDNAVWHVSFAPNQDRLVVETHERLRNVQGDHTRYVTVLEWSSCNRIAHLRLNSPSFEVSFTADGHSLLWGADDKTIEVWDVQSGLRAASFRHEEPIASAVQRAGRLLTMDQAGAMRLWHMPPRADALVSISKERLSSIRIDAKGWVGKVQEIEEHSQDAAE